VLYGLTTSGGMIGLIVSMVGGVLKDVLALIVGAAGSGAVWISVAGAVVVFGVLALGVSLDDRRNCRSSSRLPRSLLSPEPKSDQRRRGSGAGTVFRATRDPSSGRCERDPRDRLRLDDRPQGRRPHLRDAHEC